MYVSDMPDLKCQLSSKSHFAGDNGFVLSYD